MRMKIFNVESSIVFRCEESLNFFFKGKKLDKVVSGRIIKEVIWLFGFKVRVKYQAEYCSPIIDREDIFVRDALDKALRSVKEKCECKVCDYYNSGK